MWQPVWEGSLRENGYIYKYDGGLSGGSAIENLPANAGNGGSNPGQEHPLEKEMAIHSNILAWEIPWIEEPGRLQAMGSQRVRHDLGTKDFSDGSDGKASAYNAGDPGSIPGLGRPSGEGNGSPLQYCCLKKVPWTEEPRRPQFTGSESIRPD